jgi:hypothetical protein
VEALRPRERASDILDQHAAIAFDGVVKRCCVRDIGDRREQATDRG